MKNLFGPVLGEAVSWANYHIAVVKRKESEPSVNNVYAQALPYNPDVSSRRSIVPIQYFFVIDFF
jgi:hypothetical protein